MPITERYNLYRKDRVLLRTELVLSGVTLTDKRKIDKYLVGTNWEWRSEVTPPIDEN